MGAQGKRRVFLMKVAVFSFNVSSWSRICNTAPHRTCDCRHHAEEQGGTSQRSPDMVSPLKDKEKDYIMLANLQFFDILSRNGRPRTSCYVHPK